MKHVQGLGFDGGAQVPGEVLQHLAGEGLAPGAGERNGHGFSKGTVQHALEKGGFRAAVMDAVDAAVQKSKSFHS